MTIVKIRKTNHQLAKLIFFVESVIMDFYHFSFRVVWFKEQPCLSQLKLDLKIGGIRKCDNTANTPYK